MMKPQIETGPFGGLLLLTLTVAAIIGIVFTTSLISASVFVVAVVFVLAAIYYCGVRIDRRLRGRLR